MRDPFSLRGTAIDGRFRVDDVIGEGGFGVVYRGSHLKLDHPVAIKCLKIPDHFTADAKKLFLERFREEGRILLKLADIPGVPRLYDYEVHKTGGHEVPLLVMEWLDGKTLEDALAERKKSGTGRLTAAESVAVLLPAIDALATAHTNRIAHRDIKPANLFLALGSRGLGMKVLDFGIAKGMQEGESLAQSQTKTATNFRAFTPNYAAPEQFRPKQFGATGPWSDVYSLGLILVELITGAPGNGGDDLVECLDNATSKDRPSPRARGVEVSDELEAVVLKALALKPEDRYADAGQLGDALSFVPEAKETTTKAALKSLFGAEIPKKPTKPSGPAGTEVVIVAGNTEIGDHTPFSPTFPHGDTKQPVSKTASEPSERKYGAFILGAAVLVGGGALVYALTGTGDPKKPKVSEPETAATGAPSPSASGASAQAPSKAKNGTVLAHSVFMGRDIVPVVPLSDADAKGKRHVKITRDGERITIDHVNPAGKVFQTETMTLADGGWESVSKNSRGQIAETIKRTKDGVETHVARTGSPFVEGCARWAYKFSDKGDSLDRTCQDAKGHVIIDAAGCQIVRMELDDKNQMTSRRCLSADGTVLADAEGIHLKRMTYDERGNMTEESYFGADDHTFATLGCARRRSEYDDAGNWVLHTCIGSSGLQTTWGGTKIVSNAYHYDDHGCLLRAENLDADGKPVDEARIAATVTKRDEHCSELAIEWRNAAKELVKSGLGIARRDNTLDAQGNVTEWRCYDSKNNPTNCWGFDNPNDAQVVFFKYDDKGRELSKRYFDVKGNSTGLTGSYPHETRSVWDDKGLLLEKSYWNVEGKPAPALGNVGKRVFRYDPLGSMTSFACMGIDGAPIVAGIGIHELKQTYDDKHRFTTIDLFDLDGKPAANPSVAVNSVPFPTRAVKLVVAREGSRVVENVFYDKEGKVVPKGKIDCHDSSVVCLREATGP